MTLDEILRVAGTAVSAIGALVTVSGGIVVWRTWKRKVKLEDAALVRAAEEERAAAARKIDEMGLSREEIVERIGNQLLVDLREELRRSNDIRDRQEKQLREQAERMDYLGEVIDEQNRHIQLLEPLIPNPPGPPERPRWRVRPPTRLSTTSEGTTS
ncbi:hypothetical protein [Rathayibacter sp. Leaf248]|uniref:hypothetical protein n=1 Tax=Rathayibacter sp. Leaf248 TaxID=2876555 RepID=UPI001E379FA0|nr:hypothetical protein [Rathayibacter sp. Leaf248]